MKIKNLKLKIILMGIILLGFLLRIHGLNWDQGFHLHPDERAIVLAVLPLQFPTSFSEFLSVQSPLNPHFFAYGSLPMYLLKAVAIFIVPFYPQAITYDYINLIGRFLSILFDIGTLLIIFFLGKKLFSKQIGLIAGFFYAISVFPIQAAHFYTVDTPLTFLILLTLYSLIFFYENPTIKRSLLVGFLIGASLATKTSALVLIISIFAALLSDFVLIFLKSPHRPRIWLPHVPKLIRTLFTYGVIIVITTFVSFVFFEPYALIDFKEFWRQTLQQSQMTHDPFTFPFTLQYVGKIPYFYELKNIFLWGQGPIIATISFLGIFYIAFVTAQKKKEKKWAQEFILLIFFLSYFAVVGRFAVGWMRYMLPLYPLLCLFAGLVTWKVLEFIQNKLTHHKFLIFNFKFLILLALLAWPLSFINIYTKPNTRVLASRWIIRNIPINSTLAIEHWDDSLPLFGQQNYKMLTLQLYNSDTPEKWEEINDQLSETDYLILASNRLYIPLMKLVSCEKLPAGRCYTQTTKYYQDLFNGKLGFKKIAEFSTYPTLQSSIFNLQLSIDDSSADESFTVYDHPKVIIFKKLP